MDAPSENFAKEKEVQAVTSGEVSPLLEWATSAVTVFVNGFISGLGSGVGVGAAAIAQTDTLDAQTVSMHAAVGMLIAAACHGVKRVIVWHDSHPVPNPFA